MLMMIELRAHETPALSETKGVAPSAELATHDSPFLPLALPKEDVHPRPPTCPPRAVSFPLLLLLFSSSPLSRRDFDGSEKLVIFGDRRGRRGAELKCMSAVETKKPGHFTRDIRKHTSESKGFASDTFPMDESELSYALGKDGTTRRKLARASGCIMEYVGQVAFICGTLEERTRARTYLKWLLKQRHGSVYVDDVRDRDDVTIVPVPQHCVGYVTGNRGASLRQVEEMSGTFCFVEGGRGEAEQLLIFGHNKHDREVAERLVNDLVNEKLRDEDRRDYDDRDRRDDYYDRYPRDHDRRDDYDRRRDDDYDRRRYDDDDRRDRRRYDDDDRRDRRRYDDDDYDRRDRRDRRGARARTHSHTRTCSHAHTRDYGARLLPRSHACPLELRRAACALPISLRAQIVATKGADRRH